MKKSLTFDKHIDQQSQAIYVDKKIYIFKKTMQVVCK